jgi:hypothetical protein
MVKEKDDCRSFHLIRSLSEDFGRCYQKTVYLDKDAYEFRSIGGFYHFYMPHMRVKKERGKKCPNGV